MTLTEMFDRVKAKHGAPAITDEEVSSAVEEALSRYSDDLPRRLPVTIPDSSSGTVSLASLVPAWGAGYAVKDVYQVSSGTRRPLDSNSWEIYDEATLQVYGALSSLLLEYTAPHAVNDSTSTIRPEDEWPVVNLAASLVCELAARKAADKKSGSVTASSVDYGSIAEKWSTQARTLREKYDSHVKAKRPSGGVFGEWDLQGSYGFPNFHRSRWH